MYTLSKLKARLLLPLATIALCLAFGLETRAQSSNEPNEDPDELIGRAVLPAATFADGPTSGRFIGTGTINQQQVPFINKQPVQGVSAILRANGSHYYAMSDNGFGGISNSADYNLRIYKIRPRFKTDGDQDNRGDIRVRDFIELRDPDHQIPFAIVNHFTEDRILTGADFDIESFQMAPDGTFWIGDEFGPFLIHVDETGKVLSPPVPLPDFDNPGEEIRAPQNPFNEEGSTIRIMNAMRRHAENNGNFKSPVFSPWHVMLADGLETSFVGSRQNPPEGLKEASSEIHNIVELQRAGFPVVPYTINDAPRMNELLELGVDGIITDAPDVLLQVLMDAPNKDDYFTEDGLIDINVIDAQGHRGARNLRPENTLPAMEAALDFLMTTLEFDCGIAKDNVPMLDHDPYIESSKVRKADGSEYNEEDEVLVKDLTSTEIQTIFIADKLLNGRPDQTNDLSLSPVAVAFAEERGLIDPYVMPTLQQVFDFVDYYEEYYTSGPGSGEEMAALRAKNASQVRFNIESKLNPRSGTDDKGMVFDDRTKSPRKFADGIGATITFNGLQERADIQSFDYRSLLLVHKLYPQIRTICLFGDFPKVGEAGDGTNLQDENGDNTPWLAGLYWPYRETVLDQPIKAQGSGGFEGMALTLDGEKLWPLLEKPLIGNENRELLISEFDIATESYTGNRLFYPLEERGTAIGDFILISETRGLIIERDGSQGDLDGFKKVYEIEIFGLDQPVGKREAVDLLRLKDEDLISLPGLEGDVGIGEDFAFPFVTIESVVKFSNRRIGILNDNNYPFSVGRHVGTGLPDDNEFIRIRLANRLNKEEILPPVVEPEVGQFVLVDAHTNQDLTVIEDGATLDLGEFEETTSYNIRAEFESTEE